MRARALLLTVAMLGGTALVPAPGSVLPVVQVAPDVLGDAGVEDPGMGTDNLTLVRNLPHSGRGSDIEFATLTYRSPGQVRQAGYRNWRADADPDTRGVQRTIALAGTTGGMLHLYDVTVPEDTYETAAYDCPANQGDTQVFTRGERSVRTFTTYTVEDGGSAVDGSSQCARDAGLVDGGGSEAGRHTGTFVIELSDPFAPRAVGFIPVPEGSHNGSVHPSGRYFYNSNSSLITEQAGLLDPALGDGQPGIEVYDISDLQAPVRLTKLELPVVPASLGTESHDITFDASGDRAYSAALSQGVIIDTSDPAAPRVLTSWVDPTINVWHQADPIDVGDRRLLVVEDEVAGATGTGQCPNGGVHVFDVTGDPAVPTKVGYWNIDEARVMAADGAEDPAASCTAHVFRLHPEAGIMTIAYYNGGVRVVDLGGLAGVGLGAQGVGDPVTGAEPMTQLTFRRFADSNAWAAKSPRITVGQDGDLEDFHVFSNGGRGLDVLRFAAEAEAAAQGRWLGPAEAEALLVRDLTPAQVRAALPAYSCLL